MASSVLYRSPDGAVVCLDIPRSLEEAQVSPGQPITRRIISAHPRETPWLTPEPKKKKDVARDAVSPATAITELMTLETVRAALEVARAGHADGPWCLPRVTQQRQEAAAAAANESGSRTGVADDSNTAVDESSGVHSRKRKRKTQPSSASVEEEEEGEMALSSPLIPVQSHYLLGTVESQRDIFLQNAPQFDLIVLDPPWPSRSVKRMADGYTTVRNSQEARELLSQVPVASHLKPDGLVAIWVTNRAAVTDLLTEPGGVLVQWGLELIGEWIWLKVTSVGEPILDIESAWRKPWERLLIARRVGSRSSPSSASTKVILGVPDIHSRKPNLRGLFADVFPGSYVGLEIFARNLTAGWWSWGNEVLLFQQRRHWTLIEDENSS